MSRSCTTGRSVVHWHLQPLMEAEEEEEEEEERTTLAGFMLRREFGSSCCFSLHFKAAHINKSGFEVY